MNSAKVVLLKPRRQSKPLKTNVGGPACKICRRSISDSHCYCSITCLVIPEIILLARGPFVIQGNILLTHDFAQVSDADSAATVEEEPTVCCQSEPLLAEQPSPSRAASPPPSDDGGQEDAGRSIPELSVRRVHRRKGFPRRAPF